jgi:uncharacterized lipoprotein YmbA
MGAPRRVASLLFGVAALAACTATLPTRLYTLEPAQVAPLALNTGPTLGLGPIELASYLDVTAQLGASTVLPDRTAWMAW